MDYDFTSIVVHLLTIVFMMVQISWHTLQFLVVNIKALKNVSCWGLLLVDFAPLNPLEGIQAKSYCVTIVLHLSQV